MKKTALRTRPRFGVILAAVHSGVSIPLCEGILEEAARLDIDVFFFPGGRLGAQEEHESRRNEVFLLANAKNLDGILTWASSLGGEIGPEEVSAFHSRWEGMPLACLAQKIGDAPAVTLDVYSGMKAALAHLADAHGFTRIAFARGPANHLSAQERYRAYVDFLKERGIAFKPELVSSPEPWDKGASIADEFLVSRSLRPGDDIEAVVAASDLLAFEMVKRFAQRGAQVPGDIAVIGCNDSAEASLSAPPLTTVSMPFREQGKRGVQALYTQWKTGERQGDAMLRAELSVRLSCGCRSREAELAGSRELALAEGELVSGDIADFMRLDARTREAWVVPLAQSFEGLRQENDAEGFCRILSKVVERELHEDRDPGSWQNAISILRQRFIPGSSPDAARRMEDASGMARVMIAEAQSRHTRLRLWAQEREREGLASLGRSLLMTFDTAKICELLAKGLPPLGSASAFLVRYVESSQGVRGARLLMAFSPEKAIALQPDGEDFDIAELVPLKYLPDRRANYVVEPLYFQDEDLGYALFETGPRMGHLYEDLRNYISGALKSSILFAEAQETHEASRLSKESAEPILIVDDDIALSAKLSALLTRAFPDRRVVGFPDKNQAIDWLQRETPSVVLLDWLLPGSGGRELVARMAGDERLAQVPVIVLTNELLNASDMADIEGKARVILQGKDIWTDEELVAAVAAMTGPGAQANASPLAKRALAWIGAHYDKPFSRWQLAQALNVSEDHLSRVFGKELGISPWEFLTRYRVHRAKLLLSSTTKSVSEIALDVGFQDQAYFARVFRKQSGMSPQGYRNNPNS